MDKWKLTLAIVGMSLIVGAVLLIIFADVFKIIYAAVSALIGIVLVCTVITALINENRKNKK